MANDKKKKATTRKATTRKATTKKAPTKLKKESYGKKVKRLEGRDAYERAWQEGRKTPSRGRKDFNSKREYDLYKMDMAHGGSGGVFEFAKRPRRIKVVKRGKVTPKQEKVYANRAKSTFRSKPRAKRRK